MTKQKIVIKVSIDNQKSRTKALKVSVSITGVESATVKGDQVEVIGDGVDAVELMRRLRKSMSYAELVSVGEVKKPESTAAPAAAAAKAAVAPLPQTQMVWMQPYAPPQSYDGYTYSYGGYSHPAHVAEPGCTIM